jgi:16S rRNA (cytosine1402-N4)-methyltransferase
VLSKEVLDFLGVLPGAKYIDATLGGGGHTGKFLEKGALVLGIDADEDAIDYVQNKLKNQNLVLSKGNFRDIDKIVNSKKFGKAKGILFDLGVSSHQIDTPERGFSFLKEGPLDMRMDKKSAVTAEALVNLLQKGELNDIFNKFGEEGRSWIISNSIIRTRRIKAIQTTQDLSRVVQDAYGYKGDVSDFTKNLINKKVFQALRIAVNSELENITEALPKALGLLESRGRIVVISFHSLEDRVVKKAFKDFEKRNMGKIITQKPIEPTQEEIESNPRAKSAKLRVFEKN